MLAAIGGIFGFPFGSVQQAIPAAGLAPIPRPCDPDSGARRSRSGPQLLASFPHLRGARGHVDADLEDVALLRTERVKYGVPSPAK